MSAHGPGPDGRHRVGVLVPSSNTVMENDLHRCLPKDRYTVHTARMYLEETTAAAERTMIEDFAPDAAARVGTAHPHLLVFGCTSAGSLGGLAYDREVCERLGERAGCRCVGVLSSVADALERRGLRRLAVVTPYVDELTRSIATSLADQGFDVVAAHGMGIDVNFELATPTPDEIVAFVTGSLDSGDADGLFVSCTNFRALEAIPKIEAETGLPVVTSNSAVLEAVERRFAALSSRDRRIVRSDAVGTTPSRTIFLDTGRGTLVSAPPACCRPWRLLCPHDVRIGCFSRWPASLGFHPPRDSRRADRRRSRRLRSRVSSDARRRRRDP
ncbi:MAG: maleate cis-trans isomerase family protein [Streptosporangiaceae bacterium]